MKSREVFVETKIYKRALKQLEKNRVIIITGEPGIGKTTLAGQLGLYFMLNRGYDSFLWISKVDELYMSNQIGGKRVLIFDDFWGSSYFDKKPVGREETRLAKFINKVKESEDCILILTTRAYILEQGLKQNEDMRMILEGYKLECRIQSYTLADKAEIFFSHLKRGELTQAQLRRLFDAHNTIVVSKDYNPRVIQKFMENVSIEESPNDCLHKLYDYLKNPVDFWKKIFSDLSSEAKALYVILYLFQREAWGEQLRKGYHRVLPILGDPMTCRTFGEALAELEKTVTKTDSSESGYFWTKFQNPSAREFIEGYLTENLEQYKEVLSKACFTMTHYKELLRLYDEKKKYDADYKELMKRAIELIEQEEIEYCYADYFELLELCQPRIGGEIEEYFRSRMAELCDLLSNHVIRAPGNMVDAFRYGMLEALGKGITDQPEYLLEVYMNACMKLSMLPEYYAFKKRYRKVWDNYVEKNQEKFLCFFPVFFKRAILLAVLENDYFEFDTLMDSYEDVLVEYNIPRDAELLEMAEKSKVWMSDEKEEEEFEEEEEDQVYEQVVELYEKEMFIDDAIHDLSEHEVREYLRFYQVPKETEEKLMDILQENEPWYWARLLESEKSISFLLKFVNKNGIPNTFEMAAESIIAYINEETQCEEKLIKEIISFADRTYSFTDTEIINHFTESKRQIVSALERLVEIGVMERTGRCYCITSSLFKTLYFVHPVIMGSRELRAYCYPIFMDTMYDDIERMEALKEIDQKLFEWTLSKMAHEYLEQFEGLSGKERIKTFLESFDLTLDVSTESEIVGSSRIASAVISILEDVQGAEEVDFIPISVEEDVLEQLKARRLIHYNRWKRNIEIHINQISDWEILTALGVIEGAERALQYLEKVAKGRDEDGM